MKVPNTATITESLERSLQNCSLNNESGAEQGIITGRSSSTVEPDGTNKLQNGTVSETSLELNSHVSLLPFDWEQCLDDLKRDINKRDGAKTEEDPRTEAEYGGGFYSDEDGDDDDDDDSWYEYSDESSSESSPSSSSSKDYNNNNNNHKEVEEENDNVLVVGGCQSCYMYFMVPKKAEGCPKCNGHLLRFDRSQPSP